MKKVIVLFTLIGMVLAFGSNTMAFDQFYHVKQAPNGKGDLLVFPYYFTAAGGWETKLTVTNTSPVYSVIAKVVIRSHYYSEELLDFLIYLSPEDVWVGYLRNQGSDTVLYSEDDSILVGSKTFASPQNPVNQPLFDADCFLQDSEDRGYITVIETWYGIASNYPIPTRTPPFDATTPVVEKALLREFYPPDNANQQPPLNEPAGRLADGTSADGVDHTVNVLTGFMELQNPLIPGMTAGLRARVFADFDISDYLKVNEVSGLQFFKQGQNTIGELEAAMSKKTFAMPYINSPDTGAITAHLFTFPTKVARQRMTTIGNATTDEYNSVTGECRCSGDQTGERAGFGPYWNVSDNLCDQRYTLTAYDLSERRTESNELFSGGTATIKNLPEEFNIVNVAGISGVFAEGWLSYIFDPETRGAFTGFPVDRDPIGNDFLYSGAPVIPATLFIKNGGMSFVEPAYDDGKVFATLTIDTTTNEPAPGFWLPEYQYFNFIDELGLHNQNTGYPAAATFPPTAPVW